MAGKVKVTESKFKAIKILLSSGATHREIAESMAISECTVGYIRKAEDYTEYRNMMYATSPKARKNTKEEKSKQEKQVFTPVQDVPETRQTIVVQASHYMLEEQKKTNELLTLISNKLAFIVDELTK